MGLCRLKEIIKGEWWTDENFICRLLMGKRHIYKDLSNRGLDKMKNNQTNPLLYIEQIFRRFKL